MSLKDADMLVILQTWKKFDSFRPSVLQCRSLSILNQHKALESVWGFFPLNVPVADHLPPFHMLLLSSMRPRQLLPVTLNRDAITF